MAGRTLGAWAWAWARSSAPWAPCVPGRLDQAELVHDPPLSPKPARRLRTVPTDKSTPPHSPTQARRDLGTGSSDCRQANQAVFPQALAGLGLGLCRHHWPTADPTAGPPGPWRHGLRAANGSRATAAHLRAPAPPLARPLQAPTCWSHSGHDLVAIFTFLARVADMLLSFGSRSGLPSSSPCSSAARPAPAQSQLPPADPGSGATRACASACGACVPRGRGAAPAC
jgi:hypothetical protein